VNGKKRVWTLVDIGWKVAWRTQKPIIDGKRSLFRTSTKHEKNKNVNGARRSAIFRRRMMTIAVVISSHDILILIFQCDFRSLLLWFRTQRFSATDVVRARVNYRLQLCNSHDKDSEHSVSTLARNNVMEQLLCETVIITSARLSNALRPHYIVDEGAKTRILYTHTTNWTLTHAYVGCILLAVTSFVYDGKIL